MLAGCDRLGVLGGMVGVEGGDEGRARICGRDKVSGRLGVKDESMAVVVAGAAGKTRQDAASPIAGGPSAPLVEADAARALSKQYRRAVAGTREILIFGAMMDRLGNVLSRQNDTWPNRGSLGQGLKGWLAKHCPEINYKTAYAFLNLARGMVRALSLPEGADVPRLLGARVKELGEEERPLRKKLDEALAGKSRRQLEFDFGIRAGKSEGQLGGVREGAGRKGFSEVAEQMRIDAFFGAERMGPLIEAVLTKRWHLRIGNADMRRALAEMGRVLAKDLGEE